MGSGALWWASTALGTAREALAYPSGPLQHRYSTLHISVSRDAHTSRATVSNARADVSSLALVEIPIQLGMALVALVAREAGEGAYLFSSRHLFSTSFPLAVRCL